MNQGTGIAKALRTPVPPALRGALAGNPEPIRTHGGTSGTK